jgi:hypothetical protein
VKIEISSITCTYYVYCRIIGHDLIDPFVINANLTSRTYLQLLQQQVAARLKQIFQVKPHGFNKMERKTQSKIAIIIIYFPVIITM